MPVAGGYATPPADRLTLEQLPVISYLLKQGLLSAADFVLGQVRVDDLSRRNTNYKVAIEGTGARSYMLKHAAAHDRIATMDREAAVYRLLLHEDDESGFSAYLPYFYGYDPQQRILVQEFVTDARDLLSHHVQLGRFPANIAARLGKTLGTMHSLYPRARVEEIAGALGLRLGTTGPPPVLSMHQPRMNELTSLSAANLRLVEVIQRFPLFGQMLDRLRSEWQPLCLTHSDLKWTNVLVLLQGHRGHGIKIIDWELAGPGDPYSDTGSVLAEYLNFWLLSVPVMEDRVQMQVLELARYRLESVQPAIRAFWGAYEGAAMVPAEAAEEALLLSTRYCAARLVQTAYESGQLSGTLTAHMVLLMQVAMNILQNPAQAARQLLGIAVG